MAALWLGGNTVLSAGEVVPLPSFSEYEIPVTQNPCPLPTWREYLDLGALVAGLALASYFALRGRSRNALYALAIISVAWLGFWRGGCVCPIGAIQNVILAIVDSSYAIPWSVMVAFVLPLVFTLFYGRTFCAAVCPLGALQELVAVRPVKVPRWLDESLGLLAFVYLGLAVALVATGTAFIICRYDPFVGLFRRSAGLNMLILGGCFLLIGAFIARPYCRYLCPYGAILGVLSRLAQWHLRITPADCVRCGLCEDACPYGAIRAPTVALAADERQRGPRRLAAMLVLLPILCLVGYFGGRALEEPLSRLHPTARLAERVYLEQTGVFTDTSDASDGFYRTGRPVAELYAEAYQIRARLGTAGGWLGGWVGLVVGLKLVALSRRRRRHDYEPDPAVCVSCGRCFWYCPKEQERRGMIRDLPADAVAAQLSLASGLAPGPTEENK
jgi:polyferredoxin